MCAMLKLSCGALAVMALLASCAPVFRGPYAQFGGPYAPLRVAVGTVTCADENVAAVVRNTITESLLNHQDYITVCDSIADRPDLIILATVTFGNGASSDSSGFGVGNIGASSGKSTAGAFVNDVSLVTKTPKNQTILIATRGQRIKGGGALLPPSGVTSDATDDLIEKLSKYAASIYSAPSEAEAGK